MSSLVSLTRNTEAIQGYQIQAPSDMLTALQYISGLSAAVYSGTVQAINNGGTINWQLLINNATANTSQFATINDWIILENNALVSVCKNANFASLYTQG